MPGTEFSKRGLILAFEVCMLARTSLAAVIRAMRLARGLKVEDFASALEPRHLNNLENAKVSPSLETLQAVARVLGVRAASLLLLEESLRENWALQDLVKELGLEVEELSALGVIASSSSQLENGQLVKRSAGAQVLQDRLAAVLECKASGMTQGATARKLGLPTTTVHRYWHKAD
ncbi:MULTISPECIES: helix-turn-helix domain-containing protein [Pseudomonas]|uniref:Helix-turn-helix domain-containing protein n=1 Tax=Pseudomonas kurunegalensis TaxID=485880 RepID=A0ACC5UP08_9PSED|nr:MULTISPECIES: helix-turn-helix domain-containing protein [Pseudomonas]MBV4516159.1 helix-turn-helix domain-containing protein [Pseudomonas kurunegalensis]